MSRKIPGLELGLDAGRETDAEYPRTVPGPSIGDLENRRTFTKCFIENASLIRLKNNWSMYYMCNIHSTVRINHST